MFTRRLVVVLFLLSIIIGALPTASLAAQPQQKITFTGVKLLRKGKSLNIKLLCNAYGTIKVVHPGNTEATNEGICSPNEGREYSGITSIEVNPVPKVTNLRKGKAWEETQPLILLQVPAGRIGWLLEYGHEPGVVAGGIFVVSTTRSYELPLKDIAFIRFTTDQKYFETGEVYSAFSTDTVGSIENKNARTMHLICITACLFGKQSGETYTLWYEPLASPKSIGIIDLEPGEKVQIFTKVCKAFDAAADLTNTLNFRVPLTLGNGGYRTYQVPLYEKYDFAQEFKDLGVNITAAKARQLFPTCKPKAK